MMNYGDRNRVIVDISANFSSLGGIKVTTAELHIIEDHIEEVAYSRKEEFMIV